MKNSISQTIKFILFTAIGVAVLYLVFKNVNLVQLWGNIKQANFWWVGVALLCGFIGYIARAARWILLIEPLGFKPSLKNSVLAVLFGYFANIGLPRLGEIARCGILHKTDKIPVDKLIGTVIVERVFDLITLLILALITFFIKINFFGKFISNQIITPTSSAIASINILTIITFFLVTIAIIILLIFLGKSTQASTKLLSFIRGVLQGTKAVYKMKKRVQFVLYTILMWQLTGE